MCSDKVLPLLDALMSSAGIAGALEPIVRTTLTQLQDRPDEEMTWATVPLEVYGTALPAVIKSSWVFALRRRIALEPHRHPNSHQRMISFQGSGDFQTRESVNCEWRPHILTSESGAPLESRWISIPENVWHRGIMGEEDWVVVSFHTAAPDVLLEETGDPDSKSGLSSRTYV